MQNLFRKKKPKNPEQIIPTPDETYSTSSGCSSGMLLSKKEGGFATPIQICSDISLEASNKNSEEVRVRSSNHKQRSQRRAPIIGGQNNQANNNNILPTNQTNWSSNFSSTNSLSSNNSQISYSSNHANFPHYLRHQVNYNPMNHIQNNRNNFQNDRPLYANRSFNNLPFSIDQLPASYTRNNFQLNQVNNNNNQNVVLQPNSSDLQILQNNLNNNNFSVHNLISPDNSHQNSQKTKFIVGSNSSLEPGMILKSGNASSSNNGRKTKNNNNNQNIHHSKETSSSGISSVQSSSVFQPRKGPTLQKRNGNNNILRNLSGHSDQSPMSTSDMAMYAMQNSNDNIMAQNNYHHIMSNMTNCQPFHFRTKSENITDKMTFLSNNMYQSQNQNQNHPSLQHQLSVGQGMSQNYNSKLSYARNSARIQQPTNTASQQQQSNNPEIININNNHHKPSVTNFNLNNYPAATEAHKIQDYNIGPAKFSYSQPHLYHNMNSGQGQNQSQNNIIPTNNHHDHHYHSPNRYNYPIYPNNQNYIDHYMKLVENDQAHLLPFLEERVGQEALNKLYLRQNQNHHNRNMAQQQQQQQNNLGDSGILSTQHSNNIGQYSSGNNKEFGEQIVDHHVLRVGFDVHFD